MYVPLRKELGVPDDCMILQTLFPEREDECELQDEQKESKVKSEEQIKSTDLSDDDSVDC